MITPSPEVLSKWSVLIQAAKDYYVDSKPTGLSDSEYDELERQALEQDNFEVRAWVFDTFFPKGERAENKRVTKFKKLKVQGSMLDAIRGYGPDNYYNLKYDGCSLAIYLDPATGVPKRAVTCGNSSLGWGIDQTWKIIGLGFLPPKFPEGIEVIQAECLIDLDRLPDSIDPERARQQTNGYINSKNQEKVEEIKSLLTLRAYRYYTSDNTAGKAIEGLDYREVIKSLPTVYSKVDGHIMFAPADIFTLAELEANPGYCETDHTRTTTGYFLNDGFIVYSKKGEVVVGLKYPGAGSSSEGVVKTGVKAIQWNSQAPKGKDSWAANVILDPPVILHGSTITKPTAGSVGNLLKKKISPGAEISVILANSTIPQAGECFKPGNGDYMWPKCSCGYQMSEKDTYGSWLKCGNPECTERLGRMLGYLQGLSDISELDLNKFLVIDRVKWENTGIDLHKLLEYVAHDDQGGYKLYLESFLTTALQKKNLELVAPGSFKALREWIGSTMKGC